ncbi:hypothetical protein MXL46_07650 [Heyndrickxia sporothermodurans]|uniref:hypothetical protein n=1 Tax=Heyndrickxia sporothermodurans TaxID=46224 RepID=UPI000D375A64|nr:hypothetical protein [Heyndrickxia sporothermodurans]MBL5766405.1 hypothetical protein [Heyndrickxia sporothermodurans]MBL5769844.1 hypothetical protein [Heyndrickxia sporothermodurans]MBL5776923.1 hypothetical protein [Heyndrickxia sporothermodurans]MBL5782290.1 hypothetical protein [Heyndrickxia sporothermodurans]MBL5784213.1 hypothetical protein [Heyndrickxia sporothermodurans]
MKNDERARLEKNRKELSIKSMYFNRYLLVRYVSALFFFTNLYWLISLLMSDSPLYFFPLILMIVLLFSIVEQVKMFGNHTNNAKYTKYSFTILFSANVLLIPFCFSSYFTQLYPFFLNQEKSKILASVILMTGILLTAFILYRLKRIEHNEDRHYQRIKKYEEVIN